MTSDLTPRQQSVLEFIITFQQEQPMAPTVREICAHFGLSDPAGGYPHAVLNVPASIFPRQVMKFDQFGNRSKAISVKEYTRLLVFLSVFYVGLFHT
ncbi:hypothetical protein DSCO28_66840 [Desulfosarcina ovata subsp. sediminis]|uniref:LexA repressor DNA-binding domain-containing protein n=1 Tax=Desulfosarcina ovata subsp. sediminis TaxID=885957 RepID=A0A5K8A183_9BACT|nr:hypothetical protein [Desulfosarcina ovata]BBO86118.1 hypothetical protein DSCO28_66840 [Desulfosarcina ovata subsp. sediminis]